MNRPRPNPVFLILIISLIGCKEITDLKNESIQINVPKSQFLLEDEVVEIELKYYGMMCQCPQWATIENIEKYETSIKIGNEVPMDSLFIRLEPYNNNTINPFDLKYDLNNPIFKFSGQFYEEKQIWKTETNIEYNCRVLKYSNCVILN